MPTPLRWSVPTELCAAEATLASKLRRVGKFYVFLRWAVWARIARRSPKRRWLRFGSG